MAFSKTEALSLFKKALDENRLGHAYLISGSSKEDVGLLSEEMASLILGCSLLNLQAHPDFHDVKPESKARRILTEQIRHLEDELHLKPQTSLYKVAVIHDADRMIPAGANAFLKTLEEPPDKTVLLLVTLLPEAILPTIRSRCLMIALHAVGKLEQCEYTSKIEILMKETFYDGAPHDINAAFACTRAFQELLAIARKEALQAVDEEFEIEKKQYGKTTDRSWESLREEHFKAVGEAKALEARSLLLAGVTNYFATRLRNRYEQEGPTKSLSLLRALETVDSLRHSLEQGVQETLALEAGFLELMRSCA